MHHPKVVEPSPNWLCKKCGHSFTAFNDAPLPSLPEHLLGSNSPPSAQELLNIHHSAPSVQDLTNLDKEIESLQRMLHLLSIRRAEMETCLRLRRSVLSPLRRVPPEIIADIIRWAIRLGAGGKLEDVTLDAKRGLWAYSHVCQLWRSITLYTPSYWTKLSIVFGPYFNADTATVTKCIETMLSRSQNHTLSFRFAYYDPAGNGLCTRFTAARSLRLLIQCAPRWREALFTIPTDFFFSLRLVKNRIPNLESLGLEFLGELEGDYPGGDYFRTAPALRKLSFASELVLTERFQLPWSQITEYKASYMGDLFALKSMSSLLSLELSEMQPEEEWGHVELTRLRRLKALDSTSVISSLILPALQEMIVCAESEELESMIDLIERSECRITTLAFQQTWELEYRADEYLLLEFFRLLPILLVLDLSRDAQSNIMAYCNTLMSAADSNIDVFPLLTELILPPMHDCDWVRTVLVSFLQRRISPQSISPTTCTVKRVVFAGEPESLWPEMESLHRDGLQILFRPEIGGF